MPDKRTPKYLYNVWTVQGWYSSYGWEDISAGTFREAREDIKAYRQNEPGAYRLINRREPNPDYQPEPK